MSKLKDTLNRLTMGRALMLGIAIAGLYYWLLYNNGSSQIAAISAANAHIAEVQTQIDADQKKIDRAEEFKKTAAEVGSTINKLLSLIPEKFGMPDLMRIVSNEAKVAGSSLATITPNGSEIWKTANEFEELSLSIELNGSFLQHMIFLSNLTKINQILIIRKFDFSIVKEGHGDEPNVVKMVAEIVAYRYRGPDKAKAPVEGEGP